MLGLTLPSSAAAATIYVTNLSGGNEVPPNGSTGTGNVVVSLTGDLLTVNEVFSGLTVAASAAHIHCCGPAGVSVGVAVPFVGFPTTTSGTYTRTFDLTLASTYTAGFVTASGGTAAGAEAALIVGLNGGQTYANIHNPTYPGGEIRGQLAAAPVPEPTTAGLMLLGLAPLGMLLRRRAARG